MSEFEQWESSVSPAPIYAFGKKPTISWWCKGVLQKSGRVLAVADGEGRNGVWLAGGPRRVVDRLFAHSAPEGGGARGEHHVAVTFQQVDVHAWDYPDASSDVVVEIFTQFSSPRERAMEWAGMRRALSQVVS